MSYATHQRVGVWVSDDVVAHVVSEFMASLILGVLPDNGVRNCIVSLLRPRGFSVTCTGLTPLLGSRLWTSTLHFYHRASLKDQEPYFLRRRETQQTSRMLHVPTGSAEKRTWILSETR